MSLVILPTQITLYHKSPSSIHIHMIDYDKAEEHLCLLSLNKNEAKISQPILLWWHHLEPETATALK